MSLLLLFVGGTVVSPPPPPPPPPSPTIVSAPVSGMNIIRPITIDSSNLTSNVLETDGPEYSSAATYALGDVVVNTAGMDPTHHAYESLADANTGRALDDASFWLDLGATNRLRMFDEVIGTATSNPGIIDVTVSSATASNGLALFGLDAQQVQVTVTDGSGTLYDQTYSLLDTGGVTDWWTWFTQEIEYATELVVTDLPPKSGTNIRVQITSAAGTVEVGTMVLGKLRYLGSPQYGAQGGIVDYSKKTTDDFGNTSITERAYSKRSSFKLLTDNTDVDSVFRLLASYRAQPLVWLGSNLYQMTWVYGFAKSWNVEITYPTSSFISLEIEGLT